MRCWMCQSTRLGDHFTTCMCIKAHGPPLKKSHFRTSIYTIFTCQLYFNKAMRTQKQKIQGPREMRIIFSQRKISVYFRSKMKETGQRKE